MGFTDPIVDGSGALVRTAVKSPNFVAGTSGWTINQNGSAEFDNVTIRGNSTFEGDLIVEAGAGNQVFVYAGTPALGNLLMSIASGPSGTDPYGNFYTSGTKFYSNGLTNAGILMKSDSTVAVPAVDASVTIDQFGDLSLVANALQNMILLRSAGDIQIRPATNQPILIQTDRGPVQFGNGARGSYFAGNWNWSESRASNTLASIASVLSTEINSDYPIGTGFGEGFTGGAWNPYVSGYYDIFFFMGAATAATREACIIRKNGVEIAHNEAPNATNLATFVISEFLVTTDTIDFRPFYVSATTPQTLSGRINIARRF